MIIEFAMDGIKNMNQLYTCTTAYSEDLGFDVQEEHYHGGDYCKRIVADAASAADWAEQKYLGFRDRIANETFYLMSSDGEEYQVEFAIKTYERTAARLECTISAPETENYDHKLENLKVALKDCLVPDWKECTWLVDEQSAALCKAAYEKAFAVENNLRAFASKVLLHFLGVNWINSFGLEHVAESVASLKPKFTQRVPEFDNINTVFLSMTLETLAKILFKGVLYEDKDIILTRRQFTEIQNRSIKKNSGDSIFDYLKGQLTVSIRIWDDLFAPFILTPDAFKSAVHDFIEDRNHVAHSKVLSWSSYQKMLNGFSILDALIVSADNKFEQEVASDELLTTWEAQYEAEYEDANYKREYYRNRLASETGIDILDEREIKDWFDDVLNKLYEDVYQRYHLDVCFEISVFSAIDEGSVCFSVSSPAVEDGSAKIDIVTECFINDDLGEDSTLTIICKEESGKVICKAEVRFHNGDGFEGEEGAMEASEDSEYDTSELDDFREELFAYIDEELNPYPQKLDALAYENRGAVEFVADFACEQCGKFGVSINENFLPIGRCCYCGWENELKECLRCGELAAVDSLENGLCPSCAAYIEKQ